MRILGIETSCDETAAAVVEKGTKILSNVVATSVEMHTKTGGIIPEAAARQQVISVIPVIEQSLSYAFDIKLPITNYQLLITKIDAIAVTVGPGLIGSLLVGIEAAKTLAYLTKKPIIPINHLVAHIYANWIKTSNKLPEFPALALVVSGGHTDLVLMENHGNLRWIGGTRDDAAGEAFDKCARLLGLPYPGGPAIAAKAANYQPGTINRQSLTMFPRPMSKEDNFDWSFSGLKTAVLRKVKEQENKKGVDIPRLAAEVQEAIVDVLIEKSLKAAKKFEPKSFLLAGGVAANSRLREKFQLEIENLKLKIDFRVPPPPFCTDNAAAIAACAYFNNHSVPWEKLSVSPELTIIGQV